MKTIFANCGLGRTAVIAALLLISFVSSAITGLSQMPLPECTPQGMTPQITMACHWEVWLIGGWIPYPQYVCSMTGPTLPNCGPVQ